MSIYKRILVATDFSDINLAAAKRAVRLAKLDKCELILLHVIEHFPLDSGPLSSVFQYNTEPVEALTQHVHTKLDKLKHALRYKEIKAEFRTTPKSPRHEVHRFSKAHNVDLIVYAPQGQGVIGTLSSTATGILNNSVSDELAVPDPDEVT